MKFCIAFLFQNEADWLRLHLPLWTHGNIDGLIGLDGGSTDESVEIVRSFGGQVFQRRFEWDFAAQCNYLIQCAERAGFDALLRLDPDEAMFRSDINTVRLYLHQHRRKPCVWGLRRYNFSKDRYHYAPHWYPDVQQRAFPLRQNIFYQGRVHETPISLQWDAIPDVHLYHYGWIGDVEALARKSVKYAQIAGQDIEYAGGGEYPPYVPFPHGRQPQDPKEIGARAPWGEG